MPQALQVISDKRKPGQVTYTTRHMAVLALSYCWAMSRSNRYFFDVYGNRRAIQRLAGLEVDHMPSQATFEYTLPRFDAASVARCNARLIQRMRRNKVFKGPVVAAIDAKEIRVPNDTYENCGVRKSNSRPTHFYKAIVLSLVGTNVPRLILGIALDNSANELNAAKKIIRQVVALYGKRFIDVIVADRLYIDHKLINELKLEYGIDMVVEPKTGTEVLEEGLSLLDHEEPTPTTDRFKDDSIFQFREVSDVKHAWNGLDVPRLRFIEAHQLAPWPDRRGKRTRRTRHILTTQQYGTASWVHQCLRDRWWIEDCNWDLEHRFRLEHLPSKSEAGIVAYLQFLAMAYSLFQCYLFRHIGGFEALGITLTSYCDIFVRSLWALDEDDVLPLVYDTS